MTMKTEAPNVAIRAFEVLEYFRETRQPTRLKDLVAALNYPTSSAAELLKMLASAGYLTFDRVSRSYFPTPKVTALGDWIPGIVFDRGRLIETMKRLNRATGELILLGGGNGLLVQYIETIASTHPIQYVVNAGVQRLLVKSGLGWALLSAEADEDIEKIYRRTKASPAHRKEVLPSLDELRSHIATMRRDGYAFSRNQLYPGASVVATLLRDAPLGRRLAIGIAGPTDRIEASLARIIALLRKTAR